MYYTKVFDAIIPEYIGIERYNLYLILENNMIQFKKMLY
ncbi:MAG: hypothetical protein P857_634 [Candidatus Xenolissoclinum pacificiensis L6]|uniref:Uncharacterized protein n=1 Tax=Candidatus Xenolissoclinum pacificiensis L6 TaxID=1401685 RepID=W2V0G4_9RICK|nr:MAG: hypothetical protein P857_634 [Candidatus Xenolissoclinum pacificiensis L6]